MPPAPGSTAAEASQCTSVFMPSTILPQEKTHLMLMSLSMMRMSASLPFWRVPFDESIPISFAGVSEAIRTASARGIAAFFTISMMFWRRT